MCSRRPERKRASERERERERRRVAEAAAPRANNLLRARWLHVHICVCFLFLLSLSLSLAIARMRDGLCTGVARCCKLNSLDGEHVMLYECWFFGFFSLVYRMRIIFSARRF